MLAKLWPLWPETRRNDCEPSLPFSPYVARLAPLISSIDNDHDASDLNRTELDSHAKMAVVGKHCIIFDDTDKTCTANAFSESAGKLDNVPIIDAVIAYNCPYQCKTFLLLLRNTLYIPELSALDECPKFQSPSPSVENHSIYLDTYDLYIPFRLLNTFSFFETRKPTEDELSS